MSTYAVGDLQGCLEPLQALLRQVRFDPGQDRLLLTGDLVARGPDSLGCLRHVRSLGPAAVTVLGNHDLHLLACARRGRPAPPDLAPILAAPDREPLLDWLRRQRLAYRDPASGILMVHAGLAPQWTQAETLRLAGEVEAILQNDRDLDRFLDAMYGDEPARWSAQLTGVARLRAIVNILTRARYCSPEGEFNYRAKGAPGTQPAGLLPWFAVPGRRSRRSRVLFGHWSTLGRTAWPEHGVHGLDGGCVWGGRLTALRLEDGQLFSCDCPGYRSPGDG
ncbi:MAG TPA: symmetrical bis(5'-nucleosyl)-tetraphosphatase [Solimonas sp.]|nr:symmetrical bis(5'-nucleosyl)-tetraphosphatase [Solimonas sp.]